MKAPPNISDAAALTLLGERLARHRLDQNRTQADLAREAGVSRRTIARLEAGESMQLTNLIRVLRALGLLGNLDALAPPSTPSPLEQLRREGKRRRRAAPRTEDESSPGSWSWGEDETGGDA